MLSVYSVIIGDYLHSSELDSLLLESIDEFSDEGNGKENIFC